MHQIRFRLGLCPSHHCGSLHRSPDLLAGFKGAASRQGGVRDGDGTGRDREGRGEGYGGRGRGREKGRETKRSDGRGKGEMLKREWKGWLRKFWKGGKERERKKGEREERGYSPQTSIPGAATALNQLMPMVLSTEYLYQTDYNR